jgi:2-amino-4-hydroxy-6-hydroxymethyldihydropteridine diphosphokinase
MVIYLGLGSNLGDRENYLHAAVAWLEQDQIQVVRSASVYMTEPRDYVDQPWFLNTVIQVNADLSPAELWQRCLGVEREAGRVRTHDKGPRTLDVDIIFHDSLVIETPELTIPHSRYHERRFVLAPLMEIAPDFIDPKRGVRVRELFDACADLSTVEIYGPPLL